MTRTGVVANQPRTGGRRRYFWLAGFLASAVLIAGGFVLWRVVRPSTAALSDKADRPASVYVGADSCAACHPAAYDAWRGSQHRQSMLPADAASVKGAFDGRRFPQSG